MFVISVLFTLIIPPLGLPIGIVGLYYNRKHWKSYIFCIAYTFGSAAYCYETMGTSDITRYFEYIETLRNVSFRDCLNYGTYGSEGEALYIINILCWIAGAINDPHIVPMISVFIIYYVSLHIYCQIGEDYEIKKQEMILGIIFMLTALNFYSLVNNIRNVLAFSIVGYAVYLDCYKKKHTIWTLILYIIPIFIHSSACVLIAFRVLLRLAGKMKTVSIIVTATIIPILDVLNGLAQKMTSDTLKYVKKAISMAYNYFNNKSAIEWGLEAQASGSERLFKVSYIAIMILVCIAIMITIKEMKKSNNTEDKHMNKYLTFVFFISLMGISCAPMLVPIYWRFSATTISLGTSIFPLTMKSRSKYIIIRQIIRYLLFALGAICMAVWIWRMASVSSLYSVIIKPFYCSPIIQIPLNIVRQL